jgi:hypothetical protein
VAYLDVIFTYLYSDISVHPDISNSAASIQQYIFLQSEMIDEHIILNPVIQQTLASTVVNNWAITFNDNKLVSPFDYNLEAQEFVFEENYRFNLTLSVA